MLDPATGSWFVDDLTGRLASRRGPDFQAMEANGGFVAAAG